MKKIINILVASYLTIFLVGCNTGAKERREKHRIAREGDATLVVFPGATNPCIGIEDELFCPKGMITNSSLGAGSDNNDSNTTVIYLDQEQYGEKLKLVEKKKVEEK